MSISLEKTKEEICSEEVLNDFIGDLKSQRSSKHESKSKHIYKARVSDHEEDKDVENRLPFALRTNDQVPFNEGLLYHGFVTRLLHRHVTLFHHALIFTDWLVCFDSLLEFIR